MLVPTKLKVFLWSRARHSLPTEDLRNHKNTTDRDEFIVCEMKDSWRHSLIECSMARCVWALVDQDLLEHMMATTEPLTRTGMIEVLSLKELTRLIVTLLAVWTTWRKLIHEGIRALHLLICL